VYNLCSWFTYGLRFNVRITTYHIFTSRPPVITCLFCCYDYPSNVNFTNQMIDAVVVNITYAKNIYKYKLVVPSVQVSQLFYVSLFMLDDLSDHNKLNDRPDKRSRRELPKHVCINSDRFTNMSSHTNTFPYIKIMWGVVCHDAIMCEKSNTQLIKKYSYLILDVHFSKLVAVILWTGKI